MAVLSPPDVGIILSYRCHSACKHCLYNCGPGWEKEPLSDETLRQALRAVTTWPRTPQVHFTAARVRPVAIRIPAANDHPMAAGWLSHLSRAIIEEGARAAVNTLVAQAVDLAGEGAV